MIDKNDRTTCEELGGELYDIREEIAERSDIYKDTSDIHHLLAVIAGFHGASVDEEITGPVDYAHAEELLQALFSNKERESKEKIAKICCKLHKIICGHCACH